jgi:hypothetical protein
MGKWEKYALGPLKIGFCRNMDGFDYWNRTQIWYLFPYKKKLQPAINNKPLLTGGCQDVTAHCFSEETRCFTV